jgi:hypothetical protein
MEDCSFYDFFVCTADMPISTDYVKIQSLSSAV